MAAIDELSELIQTVGATASSAVVAIGRRGRGTGFVVAAGKVLTNAHNLRDETTEVTFADGRSAQASITGGDVDGDLVVLDVDTGEVTPLEWSSDAVAPGGVAAVALLEHLWAAPLVDAIGDAGGRPLAELWLSPEDRARIPD